MNRAECTFCGQLVNVVDDDKISPEELAKLTCDCEGARNYQQLANSITNAKISLEEMIKENENTLITNSCIERLKEAIEQIGKGTYLATIIKCTETETVSISKGKNKIKMKYKQTETKSAEE